MNGARRAIFRPSAVRHYSQNRERPVLLRFLSPPTFLCLWVLLGLLIASGCVAWLAQVPIYASGSAVVVDWKGNALGIRDDVALVAFLPPEDLSRLRVGQTLFLTVDTAGTRISEPLLVVEPRIISPATAQRQFALGPNAAQAIMQPSAVAIARFAPLSSSVYTGSIYTVDIEIGSGSVLSLLPLIGQSFKG